MPSFLLSLLYFMQFQYADIIDAQQGILTDAIRRMPYSL